MERDWSSLIAELQRSFDSGFLLIDKPVGEPSMRTVSQLRRITGQKKIGFAGTLDPMASGLLVMGINKATKLLDWWHQWPKEYEAEITLGKVSTTYDGEGEITTPACQHPLLNKEGKGPSAMRAHASRAWVVTAEAIQNAVRSFVGQIEQVPPMYSAKSVGGKRLYELARQGQEVERKPSTVTIHSIDILDYHYPIVKIKVRCSTGTYIRSLAHDLGQRLGVGAYLSALRRTAIGDYTVLQAKKIDNVSLENWLQHLLRIK